MTSESRIIPVFGSAGSDSKGPKTYEIFAAYWPHATDELGAKPLNDDTKFVASRTMRSLDWTRSVPIEGEVAEGVATYVPAGEIVTGSFA